MACPPCCLAAKDRAGAELTFTPDGWSAFTASLK
jgi:Domain of unknown function (DUF397)